jgi:hypothetical protein
LSGQQIVEQPRLEILYTVKSSEMLFQAAAAGTSDEIDDNSISGSQFFDVGIVPQVGCAFYHHSDACHNVSSACIWRSRAMAFSHT